MNKRILEWAEQARLHAQEIYPEVKDIKAWAQVYHEKFAELIVRECINEVHAADVGDLKAKSYYLDKVAEHLEKHFGVEE